MHHKIGLISKIKQLINICFCVIELQSNLHVRPPPISNCLSKTEFENKNSDFSISPTEASSPTKNKGKLFLVVKSSGPLLGRLPLKS